MADPLSIASGIAGLITLAEIVIERTYTTIRTCKNASEDASRLLAEVQTLLGILKGLEVLELQASKSAFQSRISPNQQYQCQRMLEELCDKLAHADPGQASSKVRKLERLLKWPMTSSEIEDKIRAIERYKTGFNLAVSVESLEAILSASSQQTDLVQDVKDIKNSLCRSDMNKERTEILNFFGTYISESNHETSRRLREPGTGLWLTEGPELRTWMSQRNSKLWLYGIPGAGKTVLAGAVVDEALTLATPLVGVAYFYCDYKVARHRELRNILASLAGQLATQSKACFEALRKLYQPDENQPPIRSIPEVDVLTGLLGKTMRHFDEVAVVVDALDECYDAQGVAETLASLVQGRDSSVRIVAFSRDEVDIRREFDSFKPLSIAAQSSDLRLFVSSELEQRTKSRKLRIRSPQLKDEILHHLVNKADGMFRWVACQIDHLCELPTDADRRRALQSLPPDLNTTYARILERINQRGERNQQLVQRVLYWLAHDLFAITADQLCEAVSIEPGQQALDPEALLDAEDIALRCSSLVRLSRTNRDREYIELAHFTVKEYLLQIQDRDEELAPYRVTVERCSHYQVTTSLNYLCMDYPTDIDSREGQFCTRSFFAYASLWSSLKHDDFFTAEEVCLTRTLFSSSNMPKFKEWAKFFVLEISQWIDVPQEGNFSLDGAAGVLAQAGPLTFACLLGITGLVEHLIDDGYDVTADSVLGSPLHCAMLGHDILKHYFGVPHCCESPSHRNDLVRLLLKAGARTDKSLSCKTESGKTEDRSAFRVAYDAGYWGILLEFSILPDKRFFEYLTESAARNETVDDLIHLLGFSDVPEDCRELFLQLTVRNEDLSTNTIDLAIQASKPGSSYNLESLLFSACEADNVFMVKHLHDMYGLSLNIHRNDETPMQVALDCHSIDTVKLLLQMDESVFEDLPDTDSIWHRVVATDRVELFEQLIATASKTRQDLVQAASTTDAQGRTPGHVAALKSPDILEAMHRHGFSLHLRSTDGRGTAHYAAQSTFRKGWKGLELLSKLDIALDVVAKDGSTIAHDIFQSEVTEIDMPENADELLRNLANHLSRLDSLGVPLLATRADGATVLHLLCRLLPLVGGYSADAAQNLVSTLLKSGLDPMSKDFENCTSFDLLLEAADRDEGRAGAAVVALAESVSDVQLLNHRYRGASLLIHAARVGWEDVTRLLLEKGADVDEDSQEVWTLSFPADSLPRRLSAIQMLCWRGSSEEILRAALEKTKQLKDFDEHGLNLLHLAALAWAPEHRSLKLFDMLVQTGLDPNAFTQDGGEFTPMILAVCRNDIAGVKALLACHADVDRTDATGWSALHHACNRGYVAMVNVLLPQTKMLQPCKVWYKPDDMQMSLDPLELAIAAGYVDVVRLMLQSLPEYGFNPSVPRIWLACFSGSLPMVDMFWNDGAGVGEAFLEKGQSVLHAAAIGGSIAIITLLLSSVFEYNMLDAYGLPPSHYARIYGHTELLPKLEDWEKRQARTSEERNNNEAELKTSKSWKQGLAASLKHIIASGNLKAVEALYQKAIDPDQIMPCGSCTPLLYAMSYEKIDICKFLLGQGPNLAQTGCRDHTAGKNAYYLAACSPGLSGFFKILINRGIIPHEMLKAQKTNFKNGSLIHHAASEGNDEAVALLIEAGANLDCTTAELKTPLHIAAQNNRRKVARLLVKAGASVNAREECLRTPAHMAAHYGFPGILEELAKAGNTDFGLLDQMLKTPMQTAASRGNCKCMQALVALGQSVDHRPDPSRSTSARCYLLRASNTTCMSYALNGQHELIEPYAIYGFPESQVWQLRLILRAFSRLRSFEVLNMAQLYTNASQPYHARALYESVVTSSVLVLETLVDHGALVNLEGGPEGTPLMAACAFGRLEIVKTLIRLGAIEFYSKHGRVISAVAKARLHQNIVQWLLIERYTDQPKLAFSTENEHSAEAHDENGSGQESDVWKQKKKSLNLDLVLWEDWNEYLAKVQPPSATVFVCQMVGSESIVHKTGTSTRETRTNRKMVKLPRRNSA